MLQRFLCNMEDSGSPDLVLEDHCLLGTTPPDHPITLYPLRETGFQGFTASLVI